MYKQTTFEDLLGITFLPEFQAGIMPCNSPDGRLTAPSLPPACPVSHSAQQESNSEKQTNATSCRISSTLLSSAISKQFLASKFQPPCDTAGSMTYAMKWSEKTTPSGRLYSQQQAKVDRISDSDCTGWPTPNVLPASNDVNLQCSGDGRATPNKLGWAAALASFGLTQTGFTAETKSTGQLNPALSRWLIGLPESWCIAAIQASRLMPTTRKKRG